LLTIKTISTFLRFTTSPTSKYIYQWVRKYESDGEIALKDRRGRKKFEEELTIEDKIKLSMKKLEIENERLRAENSF